MLPCRYEEIRRGASFNNVFDMSSAVSRRQDSGRRERSRGEAHQAPAREDAQPDIRVYPHGHS